jgi:ATP-binding cassette subfamily B protein
MEQQPKLTGKDQNIILRRLVTYLKPHKKVIIFALFLLGLTVIGDVFGPILIKTFIDDYLTVRNFPQGPLIGLASAYIFIQISNVFISYFQLLKFQEIALKIIQQMRLIVFYRLSIY